MADTFVVTENLLNSSILIAIITAFIYYFGFLTYPQKATKPEGGRYILGFIFVFKDIILPAMLFLLFYNGIGPNISLKVILPLVVLVIIGVIAQYLCDTLTPLSNKNKQINEISRKHPRAALLVLTLLSWIVVLISLYVIINSDTFITELSNHTDSKLPGQTKMFLTILLILSFFTISTIALINSFIQHKPHIVTINFSDGSESIQGELICREESYVKIHTGNRLIEINKDKVKSIEFTDPI